MTGPFSFLRHPDRYKAHFRQFPLGAHWQHVVAHLMATVVVAINDGIIDVAPVRLNPRLSLPRYKPGTTQCVLTLSLPTRGQSTKKWHKRIPITLGAKDLILGEDWICLDDAEGPMRLVNKLVNLIEDFWTSHGR